MPDTKITIIRAEGTWVMRAGGAVLAETRNALELIEDDLAPVIYFPREDAGLAFLERSEAGTDSPAKGRATHYDIIAKSGRLTGAAWSYEEPEAAAERIRGYIAFDRKQTTVEQV